MSALEPGLYRATVRGEADVTVLVDQNGMGHHTQVDAYAENVATTHSHDGVITGARPLIVLDLGDGDFAAKMMVETLSAAQSLVGTSVFDRDKIIYRIAHLQLLIGQIEAQTKPAKIEEPGLWGVVTASVCGTHIRQTFIRVLEDASINWVDIEDACGVDWHDLVDPTLIREGVTE